MAGTSIGDLFHNKPKLPTSRKVFFEVDQVEAQVTGLVDEMKKDIEVDLAERNRWFQQQAKIKNEYLAAKEEVNAKARQQQKEQQQQSRLRPGEDGMSSQKRKQFVISKKDPAGEAKPPPPKRAAPEDAESSKESTAAASAGGDAQSSQSKPASAAMPAAASPAVAASSTTTATATAGIGLAGYASDESEESSSGEETRPPPALMSQAAAEAADAAAEASAASAMQASTAAGLATSRAEAGSDVESQGSSAGDDGNFALDGTHLISAGPSGDAVARPAALRPEDMIATAPKRPAAPQRPVLVRSGNGPVVAGKLVQLRPSGPKVSATALAAALAGAPRAPQLFLPPGVHLAKLCSERPPGPRAP